MKKKAALKKNAVKTASVKPSLESVLHVVAQERRNIILSQEKSNPSIGDYEQLRSMSDEALKRDNINECLQCEDKLIRVASQLSGCAQQFH